MLIWGKNSQFEYEARLKRDNPILDQLARAVPNVWLPGFDLSISVSLNSVKTFSYPEDEELERVE